MKNDFKSFFVVFLGLAAAIAVAGMFDTSYNKWAGVGLLLILLAAIYLVVGVILIFFEKTRHVAKALLLSAGIILLIGASICGAAPMKF
ncbi:MAG: hypothetical protein WAT19_09470 [Ferruginibacter sp.]